MMTVAMLAMLAATAMMVLAMSTSMLFVPVDTIAMFSTLPSIMVMMAMTKMPDITMTMAALVVIVVLRAMRTGMLARLGARASTAVAMGMLLVLGARASTSGVIAEIRGLRATAAPMTGVPTIVAAVAPMTRMALTMTVCMGSIMVRGVPVVGSARRELFVFIALLLGKHHHSAVCFHRFLLKRQTTLGEGARRRNEGPTLLCPSIAWFSTLLAP